MTARFLTSLVARDDSAEYGSIRFTLVAPLVYDSPLLGRQVLIPAGTSTDFLSVPQLLWNVLPPVGQYDEGGLLHDYLYRTGLVSRKLADGALLEAMSCAAHPHWQRYAIWLGVRLGGMWTWRRYRRLAASTNVGAGG